MPLALPALLDVLPDARLVEAPDRPAAAVVLDDATHDSRQAGPRTLYACRPGEHSDGHDFAPAAVAAGAPALLVERVLDLPVPQLCVAHVGAAMGPAAAALHARPSQALALYGVTGTSGKTTTAYLLESVLRAAGATTGLIGTVETLVAGRAVAGVRTTPEATDLQRLLRRMVDAGVTAAAMEVSSHGLALHRVDGTRFAAALFTNLSQDHLDFHANLADYEAAKTALFAPAFTDLAVVNVDDPAGARIAATARRRGLAVVAVSPSGSSAGDAAARDVVLAPDGATFTVVLPHTTLPARVRLAGRFNVANALVALAAAVATGIDAEAAVAGVYALAGVPGRMERVDAGQPFTVLVDYAHKPDAVEQVLSAARGLTSGRVLVVLGCGGDRDAGKRPLMGRAAVAGSDLAVLTSDNPRSEDPLAILAAMEAGARQVADGAWLVEADRRAAMATALAAAAPGDIVVIAGKGHEAYQEIAGRRLPFDDRAVARALLLATQVAR